MCSLDEILRSKRKSHSTYVYSYEKISKELKNYENENNISLCMRASSPVDIPCLYV